MKQTKILFVHHGEVPGGAPRSLLNLIKALQENYSYDIEILCVNQRMVAYFEGNANIKATLMPYPCKFIGKWLIGWTWLGNYKRFQRLAKDLWCWRKSIYNQMHLFKRIAPDIIHLNSAILFTSAIAARKINISVVWHIREVLQPLFLRRMYSRYLLNRYSSKIVAISEAEYRSIGKKAQSKASIVYNWVEDAYFHTKSLLKKKFDIEKNDRVILSLGGFSWRKGAHLLLTLFPYLSENVYLIILGDSHHTIKIRFYQRLGLKIETLLKLLNIRRYYRYFYEARVNEQIRKLSTNRLKIIDYVDDVRPYILASDIVIAAHTFPHSARAVFEAWALNKPVVALKQSGADEIIAHNENGYVLEGSDKKVLAEEINTLLRDPNKLKYYAENGYAFARKYFSKQKNIQQIKAIYELLA